VWQARTEGHMTLIAFNTESLPFCIISSVTVQDLNSAVGDGGKFKLGVSSSTDTGMGGRCIIGNILIRSISRKYTIHFYMLSLQYEN
jgi:hypothetical protein